MKEAGTLSLLPPPPHTELTVEARGMSGVTKTILNPAIRFKDGDPSRGKQLLPVVHPSAELSHVRTEATDCFLMVLLRITALPENRGGVWGPAQ